MKKSIFLLLPIFLLLSGCSIMTQQIDSFDHYQECQQMVYDNATSTGAGIWSTTTTPPGITLVGGVPKGVSDTKINTGHSDQRLKIAYSTITQYCIKYESEESPVWTEYSITDMRNGIAMYKCDSYPNAVDTGCNSDVASKERDKYLGYTSPVIPDKTCGRIYDCSGNLIKH